MFRNIILGQFYPGNSILHRLDPRTKIVMTFVFMIILFMVNNFYGYLGFGLFTLWAVALARIPFAVVFRGLKSILYILFITFLLNLFLTPGDVLTTLGPLTITRQGLNLGLSMSVRLILLIILSSLLTLTTSPILLTDGLEALLKPFRRIGIPAHELAMMMTIALRFVPTLLEETEKIMKAQMARGADFESGNMLQRARALVPILVPLFVSAFRRADELATAMEARCYRGGENRTRMRELAFGLADYLAFLLTGLVTAGVIGLRFV
ncbi:MAG: energy-coupling factor transporter transmembrane protein EcfT [Firmicutes bacterium]|nr:energy-coupling factor transporter transmembrane protein EcfT [Bacillota bacterium]MCL5038975.1 energy-coupling factor transporter transmembrane protein EcfT [Bacillota bacterium]